MNFTRRGTYNRVTNVTYVHTCTTGRMNLVLPVIFFTESHLLQLPREVIGRTTIKVPVSFNTIGSFNGGNNFGSVTWFSTDLAANGIGPRTAGAVAATPVVGGVGATAAGAGVVGVAAAVLALGARWTAVPGGVPNTPAGCYIR